MKAIMVMFDSLNRHMLPPYGCGLKGERRKSLVQTIDIPATILEYFGIALPDDMQGKPLRDTINSDKPVRKAGLFGMHGGHVNCTDGRYVYMRGAADEDNSPLYEYTLMPTHMHRTFAPEELHGIEKLNEPFSFTKGCKTLKIKSGAGGWPGTGGGIDKTLLFDTDKDPTQKSPVQDQELEGRMIELLVGCMKENNAPAEQFERLGLERDVYFP
ncbi:MAG: hypothetical protein WAX69_01015 [Victivallales bacterium]